jgi:hypothetical protein
MKIALVVIGSVALLAAAFSSRVVFEADTAAATMTGCLRQGSASSVRLLRGATGGDDAGPARDYLLVQIAQGVDLDALLNHQVSIEGDLFAAGQGPEPPAGANTVEKALRRLSVRGAQQTADACAGA